MILLVGAPDGELPSKFGYHQVWCFRNCGSGDMMFLVVEGQDSTCPSLNLLSLFFSPKHMACHAHAHETSRRRHKNLPVCPLKDIRFWSHMSRRTTDRNYFKPFASPYRNNDEKEKEKKHTVAPVSSDSM